LHFLIIAIDEIPPAPHCHRPRALVLKSGTELQPRAEDPDYQQALLSYAAGDFLKAVEFYKSMPVTSPDYMEGQHYLGIALHHLGQHDQAIRILEQNIELSGDRTDWLGDLGNVLAAQGKFEAAIKTFEKAVAKEPDNALTRINLGSIYERIHEDGQAEACYQKATVIDPASPEAYRLLSTLYTRQGRAVEAVHAYCQSYVLLPLEQTSPFLLGKAYYVLGRLDEAAKVYARWKQAEPDNPIPVHLHAACSNLDVPERCSDAYINVTFDEYAPEFDAKLNQLAYRGPALLQILLDDLQLPPHSFDILDAGCGTGLCADALRPLAARLTGVDLSQAMLNFAQGRGPYDALHCQEIGSFLTQYPHAYDMIACIDTMIYFGALETIMAQLAQSLKKGGLLIFTTEAADTQGQNFRLQPSGRYTHARAYLEQVMAAHGLTTLHWKEDMLRMELDKPVLGYAIVAQLKA
jgi:predicted TPR repeat methyltransferase